MNKLIETAKELNRILESGIEIYPNTPIHEKLKQALNIACVSNPVKITKPIKATYFKTIDELNEWYGTGEYVDILNMNYDSSQLVHWVYYRFK